MDTEGIQGARDSDPGEAGEEPEGVEGQSRQGLQFGIPNHRMQPEARLPGLPEGGGRACEARQRRLLASQVPCDVRHSVSMGRCRSAHGAAMAWSLRYGIDDAIFEAVPQPARTGEGERDLRLVVLRRKRRREGFEYT